MAQEKQKENQFEEYLVEYAFGRFGPLDDFPEVLRGMSSQARVMFMFLREGYTPKEIAVRLNITERTVKTYSAKFRSTVVKRTRAITPQLNTRPRIVWTFNPKQVARPPFNAEYVLYLLLRKEERDSIIGDLIEEYSQILERFNKRRADVWFYKQVGGSLFPLLRRALFRVSALVWLGRILRRLVS